MSESGRASQICAEYEILISKACDGECTPLETEALRAHLSTCGACRGAMQMYREVDEMLTAHVFSSLSAKCPPLPPALPRRQEAVSRTGDISIGRVRRYAAILGGLAACLLFFIAGQMVGFNQAQTRMSEAISPLAVATPSMWAAKSGAKTVSANFESEQPFTESIAKYRLAVANELRNADVDWMRVRELVEAMGELRTDLELLTIHMAYLDIRTGSSQSDVANHWENLGKNTAWMVHKP